MCTKDVEDHEHTSTDTNTPRESDNSLTLYGDTFVPPSAIALEGKKTKSTDEVKQTHVEEIIFLKVRS